MRVVGCIAAMLLVAASAVPAHAMNWSVGANLGANIVLPEDTDINGDGIKDNLAIEVDFAWPENGLVPGLRFGFVGENPQNEFYFDTGLFLASTKSSSFSQFSATANYQYNFGGTGSVSPYLTGGGGLLIQRSKDEVPPPTVEISGTGGIFGAGLGIRHRMGNGHGTLRSEVRFDRRTEAKDSGILIFPGANVISFKLGFDLWDK